jgi:ABC-type phosphate transport system substrate-binding protein
MKKLIFAVVMMIGFTMISCGTKSSSTKVAQDSTQVTQNDSVKTTGAVTPIPVTKLVNESKSKK